MEKNYPRIHSILMDLLNRKEVTMAALCIQHNVSDRTIRNELSIIKQILQDYGLRLYKKKDGGYSIQSEHEQAEQHIQQLKKEIEEDIAKGLPQSQNSRIIFILQKLLLSNEYIKTIDIADEMFISKSTITCDIREIKKILAKYSLQLISKSHHGMRVIGKEEKIRECVIDYGLIDKTIFTPGESYDTWSLVLHDHDYEEIKTIVIQAFRKYDFHIYDEFISSIVTHVYLACKRIQSSCLIEDNFFEERNDYQKELQLAKDIAACIEEKLHIVFPSSEIHHIHFHNIGKRTHRLDTAAYDERLKQLVEKIMEMASYTYGYNFMSDTVLQNDLLTHLQAVQERLNVGSRLRNPLIDEIKSKFPLAYEIAISSFKNNWNWLCTVSEDEISYIAVHFAASLKRMQEQMKPKCKNILLVCASGIGISRLLEATLQQYFQKRISLQVSEFKYHEDMIPFSEYDLILTTVQLQNPAKNVMVIPTILTKRELDKIESFLFKENKSNFSVDDLFHKELFYLYDTLNKEELLSKMCSHLLDLHYVAGNYYDAVLEREKYSSTYIGNHIAIPHAVFPLAKKTTISICIMRNPVRWDNEHEIRLVFLLSIKFSDSRYMSDLYNLFTEMVENSELAHKCIACTSYDEIIQLLRYYSSSKS